MKYKITLFLANRAKNSILEYMEGDATKILCELYDLTGDLKKGFEVSEVFFKEIMKKSKQDKDTEYWIAAIECMGNVFKENESSIIVLA